VLGVLPTLWVNKAVGEDSFSKDMITSFSCGKPL